MINRVYIPYQEDTTEQQTIISRETQRVLVSPTREWCPRCGSEKVLTTELSPSFVRPTHSGYAGYGNSPIPEFSCPNCRCPECHESTEYRPRYYSDNLCWPCWARLNGQRVPFRNSEGKYAFPAPRRTNATYENRIIEREIVIDVDISNFGIRLANKEDIPFSINNRLIVKPFDNIYMFSKYFRNKKTFKYKKENIILEFQTMIDNKPEGALNRTDINEISEEYSTWFGSDDIETFRNKIFKEIEVDDIIEQIEVIEELVEELELDLIILGDKLLQIPSVVGAVPNVPAYISGNPLNMFNYIKTETLNVVPGITIFFNFTADSITTKKQYYHRGLICFYLIEYLLYKGVNVNFQLFEGSYIENETLLTFINTDYDFNTNNRRKIFQAITDISFLRMLSFHYKDNYKTISKEWDNGYGYTLKEDDFWSIYNQINNKDNLLSIPYEEKPENCLYFSTPQELNIKGLDFNEDLINTLKVLKLIK